MLADVLSWIDMVQDTLMHWAIPRATSSASGINTDAGGERGSAVSGLRGVGLRGVRSIFAGSAVSDLFSGLSRVFDTAEPSASRASISLLIVAAEMLKPARASMFFATARW